MKASIDRSVAITRSARTMQLEGIFDLPPSARSSQHWDVDLPLDEHEWNIGLIVGPSGTGKSTLLHEMFAENLVGGFEWPTDASVVDGFPQGQSIRDIVALLSSVGFSSPPAWLRPFHVLSNGERFRVTMARALAEAGDTLVALDEFTSVVDRTVAKVGSAAIARTVRQRGTKLIAASVHYDVEEWLNPDWVYQPHINKFTWRYLQPRPRVPLSVYRCDTSAWGLFGPHHYLDGNLNSGAYCFVGCWGDAPVVFLAVISFPHASVHNAWRAHRLVTLPDYQGVGIGNAFCDHLAGVYRQAGRRFFVTTAHPARVASLARNLKWRMTRSQQMTAPGTGKRGQAFAASRSTTRFTAGFEYVGPPVDSALAAELGLATSRLSYPRGGQM